MIDHVHKFAMHHNCCPHFSPTSYKSHSPCWKPRNLSPKFSSAIFAMDSTIAAQVEAEIAHDFSPFMKLYKDGRVQRLMGIEIVPPSFDPKTNVDCTDVVLSAAGVSARIFLPKIYNEEQKLPLLVYFHGGGFCVETPFSPNYHNHVKDIVSQANVLAVSVDYRRAPEHPIPIAYEDSWNALKWVASHSGGHGPDGWLNEHADFGRVFLAGDSAGGNIAHHMALRVDSEGLQGVNLKGIVLVHPYFWGTEPLESEVAMPEARVIPEKLWRFACPKTSGADDPLINPAKDPNIGKLGCKRVLVCVAEKDILRHRGYQYKELLERSEWGGDVEVAEIKGEEHVFHISNPSCDNARALLKSFVSFLNKD